MGISLYQDAQCIFQSVEHRISGCDFRTVVQMCVDVGCCREITVSQPFLDLFHGNFIFQKQAGAAVSQIMESNLTLSMLFQEFGEGTGYVIGRDEGTHFVYADVIQVSSIITPATDTLVVFLLGFQCQQTGLKCRNKRKLCAYWICSLWSLWWSELSVHQYYR